MIRLILLFFASIAMLCSPTIVSAQFSGSSASDRLPVLSSFGQDNGNAPVGFESGLFVKDASYITMGLRKYINSFTSRQFPAEPWSHSSADPLSRLEYPWEQTFGVIKLGTIYRGIQINFEGAATLFTDSRLKEQDSDWEDANNPGQKTTFSEANDFPRCWTFDASIAYSIPTFPSIQWLMGYRAQQFRFTMMDGVQYQLIRTPHVDVLHGEGSHFSQYYKIYYLGGAVSLALPSNSFAKLSGDVGSVMANNDDYHLRRDPPHFSYNATRGICWHLDIAIELRLREFAKLGLVGDFMSITSTGGHRVTYADIDQSWDGAKVWSEQKYIELNGTLIF